ncbi:uncharacterized protein LOC125955395 [Anopheles darlingi]|uniref:uncharacterized protein LOC125955395 n=1 Tax=Anopheles darlingi TaxID=43151 RepID=UPI002100307C|nr:uncharacterized protein LOC125955395 [Anopheles darlingi]
MDKVLRLRLPVGTLIVGFADDMVLTVSGQSLSEVKVNTECSIEAMQTWMFGVVQLNTNHCEAAQELLLRTMQRYSRDIALLSEPYKVPTKDGSWCEDACGLAAIVTSGRCIIEERLSSPTDEGFVAAVIGGVTYARMLDNIVELLDRHRRPIVLAGDFNAWSTSWGSKSNNTRGDRLEEAIGRLNLVLVNDGGASTFRKNGRESWIDLTFCSPELLSGMQWQVREDFTFSDHLALWYTVERTVPSCEGSNPPECRSKAEPTRPASWKTGMFQKDLFTAALCRYDSDSAEPLSVEALTSAMVTACDVTMARRSGQPKRKNSSPWWTPKLQELWVACRRARRRKQRCKTDSERESAHLTFKRAKKALSVEIKRAKKASFHRLIKDAESNIWGGAFRNAYGGLRGSNVPRETCPVRLRTIVADLFPLPERSVWPDTPYGAVEGEVMAPVTDEELQLAAQRLVPGKAPGPDGLPNIALKTALLSCPAMFRKALQKCLEECSREIESTDTISGGPSFSPSSSVNLSSLRITVTDVVAFRDSTMSSSFDVRVRRPHSLSSS